MDRSWASTPVSTWRSRPGSTASPRRLRAPLRAALDQGEFDVVLVGIDEARRLQQEIESLAPDAALLPILKFPTQSQYSAARSEFDIVMKLPTTSPKFLAAIEKARRSARF